MRAVAFSLALLLSGCAQDPPVPVQPVSIVAHDYCQIAEKLTWEPRDTRPTIDGIRRHNARYDSRCRSSTPKKAAPAQ